MLKHFKHRNKIIAGTILCCSIAALTMTSSKDKGAGTTAQLANEEDFATNPPVVEKFMVRQLKAGEAPNGENMLIEIAYDRNTISGSAVAMYGDEDQSKIVLHDDGRDGDQRAGDFIFSSYVNDDVDALKAEMINYNKNLEQNGNTLLVFDKRVGSYEKRDRPFFDTDAFDRLESVEISGDIFRIPAYTEGRSLKASELRVNVNDYKAESTQTGFQQTTNTEQLLPNNTTNTLSEGTGGDVTTGRGRGFGPPPLPFPIKKQNSLLITSLAVVEDPVRTFNPCTGVGNPNGAWTFKTLMRGLAGGGAAPATRTFVKNWLNNWMVNQVINGEPVTNRSARALSQLIKPWIDKARGTTIPAVTAANWQAIWDGLTEDAILNVAPFKLTGIVNRLDLRKSSGYTGFGANGGETRFIYSVLKSGLAANCRDSIGSGGFDGMTCIFEFGNPGTSCAAIKDLANKWFQLSRPTLVLGSAAYNAELQVITNTVTLPGAAPLKGNKSALNQLRTNEIALTNNANNVNDRSPRWQFREFKIPVAAGVQQIAEVPTAQEPANKYNGADNVPFVPAPANVNIMSTWVNANSAAIQADNHLVPLLIGANNFLAGKVNYPSTSPLVSPGFWNGTAANPIIDDKTRQNFSVATCTGCHGAEPQTDFTHVNYVGTGVAMNYWTTLNFLSAGVEHKTFISPFLTGVDVIPSGGGFIFGDDSTSVAENATDNTLTGLFYSKDPAGRTYPGTAIVRKWGFNDLERRSQDLANLININCSIKVFAAADIAFFRPLNMVH